MEDKKVMIECETRGFEEATEKVEALAEAYDGFPPQVQIKNCRHCEINIYPSQTKFYSCKSDYEEGREDGYDQGCMDIIDDDLGTDSAWEITE